MVTFKHKKKLKNKNYREKLQLTLKFTSMYLVELCEIDQPNVKHQFISFPFFSHAKALVSFGYRQVRYFDKL